MDELLSAGMDTAAAVIGRAAERRDDDPFIRLLRK